MYNRLTVEGSIEKLCVWGKLESTTCDRYKMRGKNRMMIPGLKRKSHACHQTEQNWGEGGGHQCVLGEISFRLPPGGGITHWVPKNSLGERQHTLFEKIPNVMSISSQNLCLLTLCRAYVHACSHTTPPNLPRLSLVNCLITGTCFKVDKETCTFCF